MRSNTPPRANRARTLVLLRHGQSNANAENSFSGWLDVPLTERGEAEAVRAAELLAAHHLLPDVAHTSVLSRAIGTLDITLAVLDRRWIRPDAAGGSNERRYGCEDCCVMRPGSGIRTGLWP
jgi:2,3-bisphosphoglycerate-dependent phosphoglycerate mutase